MAKKTPIKHERTKSAFEGTGTSKVFMFDPDDLVLVEDPGHPLYDPGVKDPPDPDRVAGIRTKGIIQNVTIVKGPDGEPLVAAGRHRVIDCREANRQLRKEGLPVQKVPCVYRHEKPHEAVSLMLMENFHRADRSLSRNAQAVRQAKMAGYDNETIAGLVKKSVATVENWLAISELHPDVQRALDEGRVRLSDATRKIGKFPPKEQPAALAKMIQEKPTRAGAKASGGTVQRTASPASRLKKLSAFFAEASGDDFPGPVAVLINWLNGDADQDQVVKAVPALVPFFEAKSKKQTKAAA